MSGNHLQHTILQHKIESVLDERLPALRATRRHNLARLTTGIYRAEHVHLSKVADELPGSAQQTSKTRRLRRFLANEAVSPEGWYRPVALQLLRQAAESGPLRLLLDTLELTGQRRLLVAALAYRRRALPLQWRVDRTSGVTSAEIQQQFLARLSEAVPEQAEVVLIGDGEFHSVDLLRAAERKGWAYLVRLHADTYVRTGDGTGNGTGNGTGEGPSWQQCQALDPSEGTRRYIEEVRVTKEHAYGPVHLVYHWSEGEDDPWRLVTNLTPSYSVIRLYERRMWIEELFGDWQDGRFHLNRSRLYAPDRLSRLVLALSLVYVWLVAVASYLIKRGWRSLIDRTGRRDRSYLTLGARWIRRCLRNRTPPQVRLRPYF